MLSINKWELGRQGSGYYKLKIFASEWLKMDCYILKYPEGSSVPRHIDKLTPKLSMYYDHNRLNIILKHPEKGGVFWCEKPFISGPRFILFRPDEHKHSISKIEEGTRYVLGIGWLWRRGTL